MSKISDEVFVGSSELAVRMRATKWSETAVGAVETWPQSVRALVRTMLTSRYAMWMGWGPNIGFLYNDAYARMTLGAKHPWALGRPVAEVWPEIWDDIRPRISTVLETGEATWDEGLLLFLERSGFPEETYHTFSYSPLHDDGADIVGIFCVVTEETERVIGERRLALMSELGASLASIQTTDGVWAAHHHALADGSPDLPFTLLYTLDQSTDEFRLEVTTNVPEGHPVLVPTLSPSDSMWPLREALERPGDSVVVQRTDEQDWPEGPWGSTVHQAVMVPIAQPGMSRPAGVMIAGLNPFLPHAQEYLAFISLYAGQLSAGLANVRAYAAERRRAEALARLDQAKTTFFSNVSHELRTPLTLMLGPVSDARMSSEATLQGEALELAFRNGMRLKKLVNTLLDFARVESGRVEPRFERVDICALTTELASSFESAIRRAGIDYSVQCELDKPNVYVDKEMWEKIVLNLMANAIKFTLEGSIEVTLGAVGHRAVLRVRDTGVGIPEHEVGRIFERFHRVEGSGGRSQEGTGIGLALVEELVRLHSGTVAVSSTIGEGSCFEVSIPMGRDHLRADQIAAQGDSGPTPRLAEEYFTEIEQWLPPEQKAAAAAISTTMSSGEPEILIVDDNADMRTYLGRLLSPQWRIAFASDGAEALEIARTSPPKLIITDVMMPRVDGFGLLEAIRTSEALRSIPVMMVSARAGEEARIEGFSAGADDYLVKPFAARELIARVDALVLRSQIRAVESEHRQRLERLFEHAPFAVAILRGPQHVVELVNPSYQELTGNRPLVGRPILDGLPEIADQGIIELLDGVYESGQQFIGEVFRASLQRGPEGELEECFFDFVYQPTLTADGEVDGIAVIAFEVTALANARREAEEANRAKDEFLAMLGHELRNPLAPILTALELLRLRGDGASEREHTVIERQVHHLVALVDDLLDVSRITGGKIRLKTALTELSEPIARGIELASPMLEQFQHVLEVHVPSTGLPVEGDAARLAQIVSNLLTNAAKYTPTGGTIRIEAAQELNDVVLTVTDNGIGIEDDILPHIFELFTQHTQDLDRAQGGLGLGLAIVKSLVALHGGEVTAESGGRGKGSRFTLRLPLADAGAHREKHPTPVDVPPPASPMRVLVVDDNVDAAILLADVLEAFGFETLVATDGPQALDAGREFRPDVALLDIGLPVIDGYEVARRMKRLPEFSETRLIAVTGYGQETDRTRTADLGFADHFVKPVDIQALGSRLAEIAAELS